MFDAAGVATGAEAAVDAVAQEQAEQAVDNHLNDSGAADAGPASDASSPADDADINDQLLEALATHQPPAGRREIVFVDTSVEDHRTLIAGIDPSAEVVLLDATRDGVEQIAEVLAGRSGIDAIHIVSHGSQAELELGTARLTPDSMSGEYADELAAIGQALTDEADILVYGCNFGEGGQGQEAAATLAAKTGADMAASDDLTGSAALGGDWDLEFRVGSVETTAVLSYEAQANFMGLLAAPSIDLDANNSSGTPGADYTAQYPVAGGSLPTTDIDARLADADSATLSSLTVTLTNRPNGANESLSADTTGTSITASYNSGTGVLSLSGADTVANYQRVLRTITYANAALAPDRTDRLITFVANDGTADSNVSTTTVRWGYVRDDFTPSNYSGNDGIVNWNGNWQEHNDDGNSATGRVTVSGGVLDRDVSGLVGDSTLRGAHRGVDLSQAGTAILSLDYRASSLALLGSTTVEVQVSDDGGTNWNTVLSTGSGTLVLSDTSWKTVSVDISAYATADTRIRLLSSNSALLGLSGSVQFDNVQIDTHGATPTLDLDPDNSSGATGANFNATFTEDGGAVVVADGDAALSDADSTTLTELVVTIINPLDGTAESLSANTAGTSVTASYDPATATLTLSGTDTVANYQQVLRTVTYDNSSQSPNTTARTITFQASDGIEYSNVALATVTVNAVNDPPVNTVPSAQSVAEDTPLALGGVSVNDADGNLSTVALAVGNGTLTITLQGGASISAGANGSAALTLSGSQADINATLATLSYQGSLNYNGADTLTITSTDTNSASDTDTVSLTVTALNDAPTATITPASHSATEQTSLTLQGTGLSVADVDAGAASVTATLSVGEGVLTVAAGTTGVTVAGSGTNSVTLTGTLAQLNDLLAGNLGGTVTYFNGLDTPSVSTLLTLSVNDGGNTGPGGPLVGSDTATITVTALNDAPVNTVPGAQSTNEDGALVFSGGTGNQISIADVDAGGNPVQVTLTASNGTLTLNGATGLAFSSGDGTSDATMTFAGTVTDINTALNGLSFAPTANFNGAASLSIITNDQGNSGSGGAQSDTDTVAITVTALNDAPVNTVPGPQTVAEDTALALSGVSVNDADGNLSTVALTVGNGTLTVTLQGGASISGGANGSAALTLSGSQADINATLATLSYQGSLNYNG
ncbi:MAG: DUF4347 domain-containing protein, partial [Gammaproteobacteria bacterium]